MKHDVFQLRVMMGVMMNDYIKRDDEGHDDIERDDEGHDDIESDEEGHDE